MTRFCTVVSIQCKYSAKTGQYLYAIFPVYKKPAALSSLLYMQLSPFCSIKSCILSCLNHSGSKWSQYILNRVKYGVKYVANKSSFFQLGMLYLMNFGQNLLMMSSAGKPASLSVCAMIINKLATVNSTNHIACIIMCYNHYS